MLFKDIVIYQELKLRFLLIYIISNVASFFFFLINGYLGGDFASVRVESSSLYLLYSLFFTVLIFCFYTEVFFNGFEKIKIKSFKYSSTVLLDLVVSFFLLMSIYSVSYYSIGEFVSKVEVSSQPLYLRSFFALFQPLHLAMIYSFYRVRKLSVIYFFNIICIIFLAILSKQTGQLLLLFFLFLYSLYIYKEIRLSLVRFCALFFIGLSVYPFVRMIKEHVYSFSIDNYFKYLSISLERFQSIANTQYIFENRHVFELCSASDGAMSVILSNNWLYSAIYKILVGSSNIFLDYQSCLAVAINNLDNWKAQVGLIGYFIIDPISGFFIMAFSVILIFLMVFLSKVISKSSEILLLSFMQFVILLLHGWITGVLLYIQSLLVFFLFLFFLRCLVYRDSNG